jgi:hypothetical protein
MERPSTNGKFLQFASQRDHVFRNIVQALIEKFGADVQPDVDLLNNSWLIYLGSVTVEVTFNEDVEKE